MKKKDASFWSDIKTLDDRLARDPDSFCFARLSAIYLKVGLVADALHTARVGVARHPGYLAGQRALGMACNASGLHDECRVVLEQLTSATPEDVDAQKTLASLYVASGDTASAIRTYRTVLDFRPDDRSCAIELEAILHSDSTSSNSCSATSQVEADLVAFNQVSIEDEIIELSENDIFEEPAEEVVAVSLPDEGGATIGHHDPLSTLTLAELYEQQGFLSKALDIYRTILADDPTNAQLIAKIALLEEPEPVPQMFTEEDSVEEFDEELDLSEPVAFEEMPVQQEPQPLEPVFEISSEVLVTEPPVTETCDDIETPFESQSFEPVPVINDDIINPVFSEAVAFEDVTATLESKAFAPLANKSADNVVETLDVWLENIRRIKACR